MPRIGESPGSWRARHDRIPIEIAADVFEAVQALAKTDSSPVRVARRISARYGLSFSPGTIRHWMIGDRKLQRRNVFRQEPSRALSYVIGANIGDGCTLTENWLVKLEVADYDFADTFNNQMAKLLNRVNPNRIQVRYGIGRLPMYIVKYSSRQLVKLLRLPLGKLLEIACAFPREFLRGFFDAEGHVDVGAKRAFSLRVGAENSQLYLLRKVKSTLSLIGIKSAIERKREAGTIKTIRGDSFVMRRTSFSLIIGGVETVKLFSSIVGFSIGRKTQKLKDAISILAVQSPERRVMAWKRLYVKRHGEWVRRDLTSIQSKSI